MEEEITRKDFSKLNNQDFPTEGLLKKGKGRKFTRRFKRVGGIKVELLRRFLKYLKEDDVIGAYIDKHDNLSPLHCKRRLLAPMWNIDKETRKKQEENEFD